MFRVQQDGTLFAAWHNSEIVSGTYPTLYLAIAAIKQHVNKERWDKCRIVDNHQVCYYYDTRWGDYWEPLFSRERINYIVQRHPNGMIQSLSIEMGKIRHNDNGPAYCVWSPEGMLIESRYYRTGLLHRIGGPAVVYFDNGIPTSEIYAIDGRIVQSAGFFDEMLQSKTTKNEL
jgi:hypothetical protein